MKNLKINTVNLITLVIAIAALAVSALSFSLSMSAIDAHNKQAREDGEQIFKLTTQNAEQDYCINNSVKPCTQELINQHAIKQ